MRYRYRRSIRIFPGIKVNFGKKSTSVTIGGKFYRTTINRKRGTVTRSVSTPIKGLTYVETEKIGKESKQRKKMPEEYSPKMYHFWAKAMLVLCIAAILIAAICFMCSLTRGGYDLVKNGVGMTALALVSAYCFYSWRRRGNELQLEEEERAKAELQDKKAQRPAIQQTTKHSDMYAGSYQPNPEWTLKPASPKSRAEAIELAQQMLKQARETTQILDQTTNPAVFFQRYDFLIGRCSCLVDCMVYVDFSGTPSDQELRNLCDQGQRDAAVLFMVQRCYEKAQQKIKALKTEKGKMNAAERFESDILGFAEYMRAENIADVQKKRGELELKIQQKEI